MQVDLPLPISRLGILGGTFDPIHLGHLAIAEEARLRYALDAVLFIPAGEPPHKPHGQAAAEYRVEMVLLATADNPYFYVSRMELARSGPSFTVDTLQCLRQLYPQTQLYFILGADSALEFHHWRAPARILSLATVVAATRPGFPLEQLRQVPESPAIELMPTPGLDISSTELRARLLAGESLRYLVPAPVAAFIAKMRLYTAG